MTWTFAADPSLSRAYHGVGMSGHIKGKLLTVGAWKHGGASYTFIGTGLGDETKECGDAIAAAKHQVVLEVPAAPKGQVIDRALPRPTAPSSRSGVVEGTVASDSSVAAPDLRIRG